jgi:hypothetical protein
MAGWLAGDAVALMLYVSPEPEPPHLVTKRRPLLVSPEANEQMTKAPSTTGTGGGTSRLGGLQDRKERLAEALRRNLVKRKGKKETNPESKSRAD